MQRFKPTRFRRPLAAQPTLSVSQRLKEHSSRRLLLPVLLIGGLAVPASAQLGVNLVTNGDAETGDVSGWVMNSGIGVAASSGPGFVGLGDPSEIGDFSFHAGMGPIVQTMEQTIDISGNASWIDAGLLTSEFSLLMQSRQASHVHDTASASVIFLDSTSGILGQGNFVDPANVLFDWQVYGEERVVPVNTRTIRIFLHSIRSEGGSTEAFFDNIELVLGLSSPGAPYCFGDGTGVACPCGAFGNIGEGCANTTGVGGAELVGTGGTTLSNDTFALQVTGVPGSKPGLILRGKTQVSSPVGDGLLCVTGASQRSQVQVTSSGATSFADFNGQPFGTVANVGIATNFQYWYRDAANPCSGAGFNFSNAWTVTYQP